MQFMLPSARYSEELRHSHSVNPRAKLNAQYLTLILFTTLVVWSEFSSVLSKKLSIGWASRQRSCIPQRTIILVRFTWPCPNFSETDPSPFTWGVWLRETNVQLDIGLYTIASGFWSLASNSRRVLSSFVHGSREIWPVPSLYYYRVTTDTLSII